MRIDTLEDLYLEQLKDMYSATKQAMDVIQAMVGAARDDNLSEALKAGTANFQAGIEALETIAERHDESPVGEHCKGMESLVIEARTHALTENFREDETRDAMIIAQHQRLVHFAIAGYGWLAALAKRLELREDVTGLKSCLEASYERDRRMTELATGSTP